MSRVKKVWLSFTLILVGLIIICGTMIIAKIDLTSKVQINSSSTASNFNNSTTTTKSTDEKITKEAVETQPEKPDGNNMPGGTIPNMDNPTPNMNFEEVESPTLTLIYKIAIGIGVFLFSLGVIYFFQSGLGTKSVFGNANHIILYFTLNIIITSSLTYGMIYLTNNYILKDNSNTTVIKDANVNDNLSASASVKVSGKDETLKDDYESAVSDESAILSESKANVIIDGSTINKMGDTTNTENSEFYGINAAILVQKNSTASIKNATIVTNAKGANAVFATGENSKINISNTTITTSKDSSRGLDATYGGTIVADNVTINTKGTSCASLATDRGEGTVTVSKSNLNTKGAGSPVIYSTGNITINDTKGNADGAQMVVIEGENSATINNSTLTATGIGNRNNVDQAGIMIYQSMSGDAGEGTGTFNATDSTLSINVESSVYKTAPMFFITNTNATINLKNTFLIYGSNILIDAKGTSEWGKTNKNGGQLVFNADTEKIEGNINIDKISSLEFNITNSSYTGSINTDNTGASIKLKIDKESTINLTGNSYISEITNENNDYQNIKSNGYNIYYDGTETIDLNGGGQILPNK